MQELVQAFEEQSLKVVQFLAQQYCGRTV